MCRRPLNAARAGGALLFWLGILTLAVQLDPVYRKRADRLQQFLLTRLVREGRLMKAVAHGKTLPQAELEDYAYVVQGLLDHADATGNRQSREQAGIIARTAWKLFWSERGWRHEAQPLLVTLQPEPALADGALYSPSDVLILASLRLPDPELNRWARHAASLRVPAMERDAFVYPTRARLLVQAGSG